MKISNETKIGALAAVSITVLILGFNFLKGQKVFEKSKKIYAVFKNVEGVEVSNAVKINGLLVGNVSAIKETDKDVANILIEINLKKDIHIPKNSIAEIQTSLLTSPVIVIRKGDAQEFADNGDTLASREKPSLMAQVESNINPIVGQLNGTLKSLDSLVEVVGSMFDPRTKNNFAAILANLAASSASLQQILNSQTGTLARSLKNVDTFTRNLASNNAHINQTLANLDKTSATLANAKIEETVESIRSTMGQLNTTIAKLNSNNGTIGLLLNDKKLYQNLESTSRSLNTLLDDVRLHPKRYVTISVFGRKDKNGPLMSPVSDSTSKPGNQ
ncbi:MAG TPA: MlaD family protein [Puia sp.]|jgi:phospholipid/cholesterol/gamma-HCH transport system substrate-binding protein|nr:MlaD family protein [Puia sp.]